jgi:PAS domain-containing protein
MKNILLWGLENYVELAAFTSAFFGLVFFCRRWILNVLRTINLGNRFHALFGEKAADKIKEQENKIWDEVQKLSIRLDIHERYLSIGLFICEPEEGKCIWTNEYLNNLFGIDSQHMRGFGWMAAIKPEDKERVYKLWSYSIENNIPYECSYFIDNQRTKQHTEITAHSIAVIDDENEVVCYIGYITECK